MLNFTKPELEAMTLHKGNMALIKSVKAYSKSSIECLSKVKKVTENPLAFNEVMPSWVLAEYAAQAAAIHISLTKNGEAWGDVPVYISALRNLKSNGHHFAGGEELCISAECLSMTELGAKYCFSVYCRAKNTCYLRGTFTLMVAV